MYFKWMQLIDAIPSTWKRSLTLSCSGCFGHYQLGGEGEGVWYLPVIPLSDLQSTWNLVHQ